MKIELKHYSHLKSKDQQYRSILIHFFSFSYDSVDQIILTYPSLQIKGNKINFEKARTGIHT
jgi:hypothetical protein